MTTVEAVIRTDRHSKLVLVRHEQSSNPLQLELSFEADKKRWIAETLELAKAMLQASFYFSELKSRCAVKPLHYNSWGALAHAMKQNGFVQVQEWRTTESGNRDYKWCKN